MTCSNTATGCRLSQPLGQRMADLPLDPRLGRALLASTALGCSEEVVTVAAILSVQSIWFAGQGQRALDEAKAKWAPDAKIGCNNEYRSQIVL